MSGVSRNYVAGNGAIQRFEYGEQDETVVTQRPPQSAVLLLDSLDRYIYDGRQERYIRTPPSNPNNIYISNQKLNGLGEIKRVTATDINFPWVTPNVNIRNNLFYLRIADDVDGLNAADYYLEIDEGWYTPAELSNAIENKANTVGWTNIVGVTQILGTDWVFTNDPITSAFIVTAPTGPPDYFFGYVSTSSPIVQQNGGGNRQLNTMMNFFPGIAENFVGQYLAGDVGGIPTMAYTQYVDFVSNSLTNFQRLKDTLTQFNYTNIVYRLYLNNELGMPQTPTSFFGSRPSVIYRQINNPKPMLWNKNQMLSAIDMKLYDDTGNLLYIPSINWSSADYLMGLQMSES
jgi:hypothetical protein